MIAISDKSRVALLALTELARRADDGPVPVVDIAENRGIPPHVLESVFGALRRAGILQSQRGVKGGYSFRRAPAEVTAVEVVEVVDGHLGLGGSSEKPEPGDWVWQDAAAALVAALEGVSVADVAEREAREQSAPMFHI